MWQEIAVETHGLNFSRSMPNDDKRNETGEEMGINAILARDENRARLKFALRNAKRLLDFP
jgi:hypothetical protein